MKWVLIILGTLVGLVLLVTAIGMLLPKSHRASRSARYRQTPDAVWQAITDYNSFPQWRPDVARVETLESSRGIGWREIWKNSQSIAMVVNDSQPNRRLVTRIADPGLPFGGSWTYELQPADGATRLTITENGEVYNPIFRFMARFVFGHTATMETYLKALGNKFQESVTPE